RRVRNLKLVGRGAEHHGDARERIDQIRHVTERVALARVVVNRRGTRGRRLDTEIVHTERAGEEIAEVAFAAVQVGTGAQRLMAAAEYIDCAAVAGIAVLRVNIDDAGRAVAVLRG